MLDVLTTTEIVQLAHETLTPEIWDFIAGGAETETTVWRNRKAIASLAFRARVARNVASIDTSATLLGSALRTPFILAPCGNLEDVTPDGAAAGARAAARFGTLHVCSSVSQPSLEDVAAAGGDDQWFQLYLRGDRDWRREQIARIEAAGYRALVITVDSAYYGNRERQVLRRWVPPGRVSRLTDGRADFPKLVDWETIDDIRAMTKLPLVIKGIQTGEDAALALERGVAAISDFEPRRPATRLLPRHARRSARSRASDRKPRADRDRWRLSPRHGCGEGVGARRESGRAGTPVRGGARRGRRRGRRPIARDSRG